MEVFSLPEIWHNLEYCNLQRTCGHGYLSLADHLSADITQLGFPLMSKLNTVTSCLPAQHHSLSSTSLLKVAETFTGYKTAHKVKHLLVFWSYFQKQRICCVQAFHKFVTVYCHGAEILTKDILSCSSTPSSASQETFRFKACETFLAKVQGIFRQNAEVYVSLLIHFKPIKTPQTRMNLTQPDHCTDR